MAQLWLAVAFAIAFGAFASGAGAQTVEGRSVIDGRPVELLSNGTWRYTDEQSSRRAASCDDIGLRMTFCGGSGGWEAGLNPSPGAAAIYRHDDRHYGQFVVEAVGGGDGISAEYMRNTAINYAGGPQNVTILDRLEQAVDGEEGETLVYAFQINGLDVVYANTIVILPRRTFQVVTFGLGDEYTSTHRMLNEEFLSFIRIE